MTEVILADQLRLHTGREDYLLTLLDILRQIKKSEISAWKRTEADAGGAFDFCKEMTVVVDGTEYKIYVQIYAYKSNGRVILYLSGGNISLRYDDRDLNWLVELIEQLADEKLTFKLKKTKRK